MSTRLADEQRAEVRRLFASGSYSMSTLASRFGVCTETVSRICKDIQRPRRSQGWRAASARQKGC